MRANHRRAKKSSRRKATGRQPARRGYKRRSLRFDTTAQAGTFTRSGRAPRIRKADLSLGKLLERRRKRHRRLQYRRSTVRLAQTKRRVHEARGARYEATASVAHAIGKAPARKGQRVNGNSIFNVLVLSLLVWGLTWFFTSDQFYVNRIVVTGNQRVSEEMILQASGLQGYSVFWVNPRQVAANISASVPPIRHVSVQYRFPNVVALVVQEEGEQVVWQVAGKHYWVSDDGSLHPAYGENEQCLLVEDIRHGLPDRVDTEALIAARQITQLLPGLRVVEYAPITGLRFTHSRGWVVYLGTGGDMARKVSVLRAMEVQLTREESDQLSLVDLRFPDSPYYRLPAKGAGGE